MLTRAWIEAQPWVAEQREAVLELLKLCESAHAYAASLVEVVAVLDSRPHRCPECGKEISGAMGWLHEESCRVQLAIRLDPELPARHDEAVIARYERQIISALRGGKPGDGQVSVELAGAMGDFIRGVVQRATEKLTDERDALKELVQESERTMVSRALVEAAWACFALDEATEIDRAALLLREALGLGADAPAKAIPMVLRCPECGRQHIDTGTWSTKPHRTHLCDHCNASWRPADVPTVGVLRLEEEVPDR